MSNATANIELHVIVDGNGEPAEEGLIVSPEELADRSQEAMEEFISRAQAVTEKHGWLPVGDALRKWWPHAARSGWTSKRGIRHDAGCWLDTGDPCTC